MLDLLLRLNDSIIGYASGPEILLLALACWALVLSLHDQRRGRGDWASMQIALDDQKTQAAREALEAALVARQLAVRQRMSSNTIRLVQQMFFLLAALALAVFVPDYFRLELRTAFFFVTAGLCASEALLIVDLHNVTRTWGRVNAIIGERDGTTKEA